MSEEETGKKLLDLHGCLGRIWAGSDACNATFDVSVDRSGRTTFKMAPQPLDETNVWLMGAGDSAGRLVKPVAFEGQAPDGCRIRSDSLYVTRWGSNSIEGAAMVSVDDAPSHLRMEPGKETGEPASAASAVVKYLVPGVLGFRQQTAMTSSGKLTFSAQTRLKDASEVSGILRIEATKDEARSLAEWLENCERECRRILEILSLVEGRFFIACSRDIWCGENWTGTDSWEPRYFGPAAEPLWYPQNLDPFIQLAVRTYSDALRESRGLDVAIPWFFAHSSYVEVKLTTVQATLEYLVTSFERSRGFSGSALPKELFLEHLRPGFEAAIDTAVGRLQDIVDAETLGKADELFRAKIGGMNALTIRERLFRMLDEDRVPYAGLQDPVKAAIAARGSIVHGSKGIPGESGAYIRHIAVLRELVKRIILTLLGYRGKYISYLNGVEEVDFPPAAPTVVKP